MRAQYEQTPKPQLSWPALQETVGLDLVSLGQE